MARLSPYGGHEAAPAVLDTQLEEPDVGPQVRFCERLGGAIPRAYSTPGYTNP